MRRPAIVTRLLGKLRRSASFTRAHERLACSAVGDVLFIKRGCTIRGVIDEVSRGGLRLRPAQSFIVNRTDEDVRVKFGRFDLQATIVNTSADGYGIKLKTVLTPADVTDVSAMTF